MRYLQPIQETSYLTASNAPQYRRIMRIFYNEYEKMRFQLYKEDVYEIMKQSVEFEEYSMDQLKQIGQPAYIWGNRHEWDSDCHGSSQRQEY